MPHERDEIWRQKSIVNVSGGILNTCLSLSPLCPCAAPLSSKAGSSQEPQQGRATRRRRDWRRFKAETIRVAMDHEARNGTGSNNHDEEFTNIYFIVADRMETASYKANQVTDMELKGQWKLLSYLSLMRW